LVLLMIDGLEGPSDQDAKILQEIIESHKAVLLVVNKLDLGEERDEFRKTVRAQLEQQFHFYADIPITFISAKTGKGLKDLFAKIEEIRHKLHVRISTAELNDFFMNVIRQAPAPVYGTRNVKFYYLTQTKQSPPSFIAFANHPDGVDNAYRRFLSKRIKERWGLEGIPIRIFVMKSAG
jgi:GTPase